MIVEELWRYPVKSMGGEQVEIAKVTEHGLVGDRRWGIRDNATGMILTARRQPQLLMAQSRLDENGAPLVCLPDGSTTDNDIVLSAWLGKDVSLVEAGTEDATYESPSNAELEDDWYTWTGPGVALHDEPYARLSIVSTSSLGGWDVRRVRSNIVVSSTGETDLVGSTVSLGSALLNVMETIPRCVMVTRPQPGIERDLDVLKLINRDHGGRFSVGALIAKTGSIAIGDEIRFAESIV